jgi:hypothetical protein
MKEVSVNFLYVTVYAFIGEKCQVFILSSAKNTREVSIFPSVRGHIRITHQRTDNENVFMLLKGKFALRI